MAKNYDITRPNSLTLHGRFFCTLRGRYQIGNYHDTKSLCIKAEKIIIDFKDYRNDCSDLANVYVATHYSDINDDVILFTQNNAIKFYEIAKEIFSLVSNEIAE